VASRLYSLSNHSTGDRRNTEPSTWVPRHASRQIALQEVTRTSGPHGPRRKGQLGIIIVEYAVERRSRPGASDPRAQRPIRSRLLRWVESRRISIVHGTTAEVIWCDEIGHETTSTSQFATTLNLSPVAGDWVSIRDGYIISVSARTTELRRPGAIPGDVQVLAANIDVVLVVLPIDRDLNVLMLERLAVMAFDSGATPIVVLTKADGTDIVESIVAEAQETVPGVDVMTTSSASVRVSRGCARSSTRRDGRHARRVGRRQDVAAQCVGGSEELTAQVSRSGEGRHATTTRRLYRLSSGGVLLDIPGIRLLDLTIGQQGLDTPSPISPNSR